MVSTEPLIRKVRTNNDQAMTSGYANIFLPTLMACKCKDIDITYHLHIWSVQWLYRVRHEYCQTVIPVLFIDGTPAAKGWPKKEIPWHPWNALMPPSYATWIAQLINRLDISSSYSQIDWLIGYITAMIDWSVHHRQIDRNCLINCQHCAASMYCF